MLEGRYPLSPPGTVGNRTKDHHLSEATDHDSSHTVLQPHSATSESSSILHSVQMLASVPDSSRDPVSVGHADRQASSVRDRWLEIGLHSSFEPIASTHTGLERGELKKTDGDIVVQAKAKVEI